MMQVLQDQRRELLPVLQSEAQRIMGVPSANPEELGFQGAVGRDLIKQLVDAANQLQILNNQSQVIQDTISQNGQETQTIAGISLDYTKVVRDIDIATNSLTQGEQVPLLWPLLLQKYSVKIHFAHRTFQWSNEASGMAAVHCVIIGFGCKDSSSKRLFEYETPKSIPHELIVQNISPYLTEAPDVVVAKKMAPIGSAPRMGCGSKPSDGGHLILTDTERNELLEAEPAAGAFLRPYVGSQEFLNGGDRWCLWLEAISPTVLKQLPNVLRRVQMVKAFREASSAEPTRRAAAQPSRFFFVAQPNTEYIAIPEVSSERRTYVPIGYLPAEVIASNKLYIIDNPSLLVFGVLQSMMHGAWIRTVGGRLKSDIQYSGTMVYNTFPWPDLPQHSEPNQAVAHVHKAQAAIEIAAQGALDARAQFQSGLQPASLADLYDPLTMPPALLKAHQKLDAAVDKAYEASGGKKTYKGDAERVAFLFELYQRYTSLLPAAAPKAKRRGKVA